MELITKPLRRELTAFEGRFESALAMAQTPESAKALMDETVTFQRYAEQIKAGVEIERPIAKMVLRAKGNYGRAIGRHPGARTDLLPQGKEVVAFGERALAAFRKIGDHFDLIVEFCKQFEGRPDGVPTQADFLKWVTGGPQVVNNTQSNNEWYTPSEYVEAAREVLGEIDLDPASSKEANKTVKAARFFTSLEDGLQQPWEGRVFLNPPYGREVIGKFVTKLLDEFTLMNVTAAVLLTNNATESAWGQAALKEADAVCFPDHRIQFNTSEGEQAGSPLQGQMFCYFGTNRFGFQDRFKQFGVIW